MKKKSQIEFNKRKKNGRWNKKTYLTLLLNLIQQENFKNFRPDSLPDPTILNNIFI